MSTVARKFPGWIEGTILACLGLALFAWAHAPSRSVTFRVEHWDILNFYRTFRLDPWSPQSWVVAAFWTPLGDYRFIPGAYLFNLAAYATLGNSLHAHWWLTTALHLLNGALVALIVHHGSPKKHVPTSVAMGVLFLLLPSKFETVSWTFFSYKLFHATAFLLSILCALRFRAKTSILWALLSSGMLLACNFIYEATLPVGLVVVAWGAWVDGQFDRARLRVLGTCMFFTYLLYGFLRRLADVVVPEVLQLGPATVGQSTPPPGTFIEGAWRWLVDGLILPNLGVPLTFWPTQLQLRMAPELSGVMTPIAGALWCAALALAIRSLSRSSALPLLGALGAGAASAAPVLVGRVITNGPQYLSEISMYQYLPTMWLVIALGTALAGERGGVKTERLTPLLLTALCVLCAIGLRSTETRYAALNAPEQELLAQTASILADPANVALIPENIVIPFKPLGLTNQQHAFDILSTMYPDRVFTSSMTIPSGLHPVRVRSPDLTVLQDALERHNANAVSPR